VELAKTNQMSANQSLVKDATAQIVRTITSAATSHSHHNQNRRTHWRLTPLRFCLLLLVVIGVLAGCGPEKGESDADMTAETIRIAQEYQQSGNLGDASAQLSKLAAANPTQFLVFLAEERVNSDPGAPETSALVNLALALGIQSSKLVDYGLQNGLLAQAVAPTSAPAIATTVGAVAQPAAAGNQNSASAVVPVAVITTATPPASVPVNATPGTSANEPAATTEVPVAANPLPTPTVAAATATPVSKPQVQAAEGLNVRSGPGTAYPVVGALDSGEQADIVATNPEGDWWEVNVSTGGTGWVYGPLVQTSGDTGTIAVASDIPPAPPTPTPAPIAEVPTAQPEQPGEVPTDAAPPTEVAPPADAPPPATSGNDFIAIERRLWNVEETGGAVDSAGSVRCGLKRELHVIVLDANGGLLNGVAVQAIYGAQEIYVTGSQGKGDGQSEFVLGAGQGVKVIRDTDGREVTSDVVDGLSTHSPDISHADLIAAGYCHDDASCDAFNKSAGCWGHHSWTVTFKRRY
jgi:hypothetical protein